MSVRGVLRFVTHRITEHPDVPAAYSATCKACGWSTGPEPDAAPVDVACLEHAGRSGHRAFRRLRGSDAFVVREDEKDAK
ncbi:hypothetical protein ACFVYR_30840 [Streptomyces sp. NPDC058284]|uniref:DUF7848 domain-containing protein n=1 Tax=unclassified Streptomyces TaxID=2593676 RepID=UPI003669435C